MFLHITIIHRHVYNYITLRHWNVNHSSRLDRVLGFMSRMISGNFPHQIELFMGKSKDVGNSPKHIKSKHWHFNGTIISSNEKKSSKPCLTEGNQQGTPKQTWLTGRLHAPKGWYTLRSCSCFHHPNVCTNWPSGNNRRIRWKHCKQYITTNMHGFSLIMIHNVSYVCLPSNFLSTSWCAMMKLHGMKGTPSSHHREWYSWNHNGYINPYAWGLWHMVNHGKPNHINLPTPGSYSSTVGAVPVACECARPLQTHTCRKIRGVGDDMDVSRSSTKKNVVLGLHWHLAPIEILTEVSFLWSLGNRLFCAQLERRYSYCCGERPFH